VLIKPVTKIRLTEELAKWGVKWYSFRFFGVLGLGH
jgi:hypothetical protein